jgi:hypothetical protein
VLGEQTTSCAIQIQERNTTTVQPSGEEGGNDDGDYPEAVYFTNMYGVEKDN